MVTVHNLFDDIPGDLPEELSSEILRTGAFRVERIVSKGQASPPGFWYDQGQDEWVLLVSGSATLLFEDGRAVDLKAGDYLLIPARCRHRVERTDPGRDTVWLALHYGHAAGR
jgi:cupin 2 domain-containing protein